MLLTFTPDDDATAACGRDKQEWKFRGDKLMTTEAEAIEKVTGEDYAEFGRHLLEGRPMARRAVVWVFLKRSNPPVRFSEVDFPFGALQLDFEDEEKEEMRQAIDADRKLTADEKAEALAELGFADPDSTDVADELGKGEGETASPAAARRSKPRGSSG